MRLKDNAKYNRIFNSAIESINELGLSGTSISKIAKKADVSVATIYIYFENKEDLINKVYLGVKEDISEATFRDFRDSLELFEAFSHALTNFVKFLPENTAHLLFLTQFANSPLINNFAQQEGQSLFHHIYSVFEKGIQQNLFKDVDTKLLVTYIFDPIMNYLKGRIDNHSIDQRMIKIFIDMSWQAVIRH
ncbi:TetR/AcrR family transcriptional regulator [Gracilibacillus ureilyticus]|nr:TetR/AcrR family transcriptional regulator [Gracilibacillus ureilyticus]